MTNPAERELCCRDGLCHFCEAAADPETCWEVYDTPVGSFELTTCEDHADAGARSLLPQSAAAVVMLALSHPVRRQHEG